MATPIFETWDIVKIPFPYIERPVRQVRPALVIGAPEQGARHSPIWLMMITSAANRGWPGDVTISDLEAAGLPIPSIVRPGKLATIEAGDATRLGRLDAVAQKNVARYLRDRLRAVFASA
ncbi:MAG TPA: type II toxin-antitoxin system PemK/MazF family toxin [Stellaceae bacterium]|nr:type II toxin-antitoxin system PemK/MazF family toxin [Stellaceae bacterium]